MTTEQQIMTSNLTKTFELIELTKNLSVAKIMQEHRNISRKDAEILFWKEVRRIKDIASGISHNES